ncbi:MAG: sigma-70 family RNA polymerase sigma factor, partial [Cellulosilyticaceae bacterium]
RNEKALEYILQTYGWIIKTVVKKHLYNLEAYQEECINDILMGIWTHIDRFDPTKSTFKNWVAGIAKYKALNYVRKYLKDLEQENIEDVELSHEDTSYTQVVQHELDENMTRMLECLKPKDRELFIKLYVQEQDIDQISVEMGVKRDVIYNRVSRGKKKIQQLFNLK